MSCDDIRVKLTAYLDGELEGDRGTVIRGHLRECAACRQVATDEAALRDGLRQLPPVDPPPSLWAGVQAQLAAAEVAEARRPAWRRAVARWAPMAPRFAMGGLVAAAAITLLWWRTHPSDDAIGTAPPRTPDVIVSTFKASGSDASVTPSAPADVTADLAGEAARVTETYADAAEELLALADEARPQWPADRKDAFDHKVAELRDAVATAADGRPKQRAWRGLIRYLQGAVVRDEIALAGAAP